MENLYSISECHDISFCNLDELDTTESPKYAPCGKVVPNVRAYILDDQLQQVRTKLFLRRPRPLGATNVATDWSPCVLPSATRPHPNLTRHAMPCHAMMTQVPVGVPGRMWIAGPTLAIGYLNMPERTAERFVPDPFAKAAGREERMYDTGDRCRYLPSGSIEVIGRCDYMVKVHFYTVPFFGAWKIFSLAFSYCHASLSVFNG